MKKILLSFTVITSLFLSCNNEPAQNDVIRQNAEELIKKNMNDPESYEFVSIQIVDSTTYKDNIEHKKKLYIGFLESEKKALDKSLDKNDIESSRIEIQKDSLIIAGIDSIEKEMGNNVENVASYTYILKCRGNNKLGAKVLVDYYIQTKTAEDKIINITDSKNKLYFNPCDFPGFADLIKKHNPKYPLSNRYDER